MTAYDVHRMSLLSKMPPKSTSIVVRATEDFPTYFAARDTPVSGTCVALCRVPFPQTREDNEITKKMRECVPSLRNRVEQISFACRNDAPGLSSSEVTKFAALVIQERFNLVPPQFETGRQAHNTALITKLLQRLDLAAKYLGNFQAMGIRFEVLQDNPAHPRS